MNWLIERIIAAFINVFIKKWFRVVKQQKSDELIDKTVAEEAEAVKKAKSDEEFDRAATDMLNR
jgi:hypothetical protein